MDWNISFLRNFEHFALDNQSSGLFSAKFDI